METQSIASNPRRAWELKDLAARGTITKEQMLEWETLRRNCPVNHSHPDIGAQEADSCGVCAKYLG